MAKIEHQWMNVYVCYAGEEESVMLPLDDEKRECLLKDLQIEKLSDGYIYGWHATQGIEKICNVHVEHDTDIEKLSEFAEWVMWACEQDTDPNPTEVFTAVLYSKMRDHSVGVDEAIEITKNLDRYEVIPVDDAFEYGYEYLYGGNNDMTYSEFAESVEKYIDFEEYGKMRLEADGAIKTEHGYVIEHNDIQPVQGQDQSM